MSADAQIQQILGIVQSMQKSLGTVQEDVGTLKADVAELKTDVAELKTDVAALKESDRATQETLQFMQEQMVTKQDLEPFATKADLAHVKSEILEHIDGFAKQQQKFDHELVSAQAKFNRVETRVEVLELKAGIRA